MVPTLTPTPPHPEELVPRLEDESVDEKPLAVEGGKGEEESARYPNVRSQLFSNATYQYKNKEGKEERKMIYYSLL